MTVSALRRVSLAIVAAVGLLIATGGPASAERERIVSFDSDITVRPDGWLHVVETIEVVATGDSIRRGIYRDFPTRSLTEYGVNRRVDFEIDRIERDGRREPYHTEQLNAGVRVYVGNADVLLRPGRYRYTIAYDTSRQLYHWPDTDELYWNVTGDAWAFPIERATATVHLPEGAAVGQTDAYTGPRGARGDDFRIVGNSGGTLRIATTRTLLPGEGLTIATAWPAGLVDRPTQATVIGRAVYDNAGLAAGAFLTAVLLVYFLVAWHRVGRDPRKGVVFPRFEAPDGLSPVAVGYVWHGGFGNGFGVARALTVAITSLATKRRLVIDDDGKRRYTLSAVKGARGKLPPGELAVYKALFPHGRDTASFGSEYEPAMGRASSVLLDAFDWEYGRAYFRSNSRPWLIGALIAVTATLSSLVIDATGQDAWLIVSVMAVFATALLTIGTTMVILVSGRWSRAFSIGTPIRPILSLGQLVGGIAGFLAAAVVGLILADFVAPAAVPLAALPVLVTIAFWFLMKAPTRLGRRTLDAIEGYRLYLSVAEADRLNSAGREPEVTTALFETHLPYAMALGVEEQWTDKVMARLEASTDKPFDRGSYRPRWYRGDGSGFAKAGTLAGALSQGLGSAAAHAMSRPSSSGSSGGGFSGGGGSSGGGGGGGGGGGW
ncbi:hypothetical protein GCM10017083_32330 [Thalassobaculum fulvum]|uniref:DUF2207 domain-containing protein n=1 Tax=Thalassobaculum fulvum TaxID=1633335 RepID=A0A918XU58_9PROT|nr:DUF2207 domain-containing protein [Thalassobaculum fulvum]GHD54617.1 hypothetical protein GCM10017083_32330 [Thalassobaculum fulvum]